ncbi:SDR family NAD(P)-dependent oxidoreductase [Streptomyces sp. AA1529]|uniref:SDR family NAD(P)-dependent oxidoreductase n=1 Tax=Streptomyces sp. AA1529 TaxID=1203257 RepID=UPI003D742FE3
MEKKRRIALVSGSSSGIGAAVARRLTESGMRVVNSSSSTGAGEKLAEELPGAGYIRADVARPRGRGGGLRPAARKRTLRPGGRPGAWAPGRALRAVRYPSR